MYRGADFSVVGMPRGSDGAAGPWAGEPRPPAPPASGGVAAGWAAGAGAVQSSTSPGHNPRVAVLSGAGTDSSSGSNKGRHVPEFEAWCPARAAPLRSAALLRKGAVGGAQIGQDPHGVPSLQLGVHSADAGVGNDHVVVVSPPDIGNWN